MISPLQLDSYFNKSKQAPKNCEEALAFVASFGFSCDADLEQVRHLSTPGLLLNESALELNIFAAFVAAAYFETYQAPRYLL